MNEPDTVVAASTVRPNVKREGSRLHVFVSELLGFGVKEAQSCVFPLLFFGLLILSKQSSTLGLHRYDFIFIVAVLIQIALLVLRFESLREFAVLCAFHAIGLALEIFKTHPSIASWSYPEPGIFKVETVPLYSGFMYAAVASYMCQAWRRLQLELVEYPPYYLSVPLAVLIYANFFTHHFIGDYRWYLTAAVILIFFRTKVVFVPVATKRRMPLALSFVLIGFFVWIAENISTYFGAWVYPEQAMRWRPVSLAKISSWALLVIISFIIVAGLKHVDKRGKLAE